MGGYKNFEKKTTIEITFISDGKEHRKFIELTIWT